MTAVKKAAPHKPQPVKTGGFLSISAVQFKVLPEDAERFARQLKERYFSFNRYDANDKPMVIFTVYVTLDPNDLGTYKPA